MKYYIFASDPHGTGQPWINKVKKALAYFPTAQVIFGGDYIDGRKFSKETVAYVRAMQADGHIALMGNHEQLMLDAIKYNDSQLWDLNGGKTTVRSFCGRSYGKQQRLSIFAQQNEDFINWASKLPTIYETEHNIFVHAGLNLKLSDPILTNIDDRLWLRGDYWWESKPIFAHNPFKKTIVSGHTPTTYIYGHYAHEVKEPILQLPNTCPVVEIKYPYEYARIFTDGGCHGSLPNNLGNVVVLDDDGNLVYDSSKK